MAARKKGTAPRKRIERAPSAHEFTVVLEDIRSNFKVFGESLGDLRQEVRAGFKAVDERFAQVDRRFEAIERDMGLVKVAVTEQRRELAAKVSHEEVARIVELAVVARTGSQ